MITVETERTHKPAVAPPEKLRGRAHTPMRGLKRATDRGLFLNVGQAAELSDARESIQDSIILHAC